jgi:hypothetical protein
MKTRLCWHLVAAVLILAVVGCGNNGLVNATGRLTYQGKPVPSTLVTFWPEEEGKRASTGVTDDNGNFTLSYSRQEPGVLVGRHTVFLKYHVSMEEETHQIPPKASKDLKTVIAKYGDVKTSPLRYEVTTNGQVIEINLE